MNTIQSNHTSVTQEWFNGVVQDIRYDQLLFEGELMDEGKKKIYEGLINKDYDPMFEKIREASSAYYIKKLVSAYFVELTQFKARPNKIALELSDSKILVWAEVKDDDEEMEKVLILSEAKVNAEFINFGFNISSTIVEESDGLSIPNHYISVEV